jgi:hypothetical protein
VEFEKMWSAITSTIRYPIFIILILNLRPVAAPLMGPLNGDQPWHICSTAMKENPLAIKSVTWQGPGNAMTEEKYLMQLQLSKCLTS